MRCDLIDKEVGMRIQPATIVFGLVQLRLQPVKKGADYIGLDFADNLAFDRSQPTNVDGETSIW